MCRTRARKNQGDHHEMVRSSPWLVRCRQHNAQPNLDTRLVMHGIIGWWIPGMGLVQLRRLVRMKMLRGRTMVVHSGL